MTAFTLIMSFLLVGAFADQMQDTCPSKSGTAGEVSTIGGPLVEQEEALADDVHEQAYESPSTLEHVLMVQYFATKLHSTKGKNDLPEKNDQSNALSLQVTEHTIQQKSTMHYLDAWQDSWHDYDVVMRQAQGDDSQKWLVTKIGENEYTIQQKATMYYLDAWEDWSHDYRAAMRQAQGDDSQKWIITQPGANEECSIKQKATMRAMDAYESGHDYSAVTRSEVGDDTQLWIFDPPLTFPTPEPAPVPYLPSTTSSVNYIDWSLCDKSYKSNLGGLGPDTDAPEELRFYNITDEGSEGSIDLVITATSEYTAKSIENNGVHGCFGTINVKSSKSGTNAVDFNFNTYKTGTNEPVAFPLHYFTLFDMDESDTAVESITLYDRVEEVFQYPDDELAMEGDLATGLTFTSTEFGVGADNPVSPMNLTETQLKRSVTVSYKETHEWKVTFGVTGGSGGRNFMFAGRSQLAPTPSPTPSPTTSLTVTSSSTPASTSAPTPAPTPASTSAPTPASTSSPTDASGGFGDPHMVNIMGEHFNIWRLGEVELLRIPRDPMYRAQIRFVAKVSNENEAQSGNGCTRAPYMTAMRLSGSWFGNRELFIRMVAGEMRVHVGSKNLSPLETVPIEDNLIVSRPSEALVTVQAGNATINVMHDAFFKPYFYLNTEARNLGSLGSEIGGVLGLDDHTVVAQKPAGCENQFVSVLPNVHGSHASASLQN